MNVKNVLVCGAGMMGKNIALVCSSVRDCQIAIQDIRPVDVLADIRINCKELLEKGILSSDALEERLSRIHFVRDLDCDAAARADLVVECVFEDMELKRRTFAALESICRKDAIFCTNTSAMSPTEIGRDLRHRERFVGTHFWNPAHLIPLVEVVKTDAASDETVDVVMEFLRCAGKSPALCKKDVPGFIGNRMQHALWREAISLVEHGVADAETVDDAIKNSFGLRLPQLPPLMNADLGGIDLTWRIHTYLLKYLEDSHEPSPCLSKLYNEKKLGFKSGEGFYRWTPEEIKRTNEDLNSYLIRMIYGK
ncbi:MAG: 3-hydroxyacyl-CoA dehydrogenase family protein [Clostridiales Family XIII bacterium]|nr:3-hydroxyacyl-CoA dehydrogenase family protein [Clostridiales Family XIII bacterium]